MEEESTLSERLRAMVPAAVSSIAQNIMLLAFGAALLAALYLLFGLFSGGLGGYAGQSLADKQRLMANIGLASSALGFGLAVGALCAVLVFFAEEITGFALLLGGLAVGMGLSYVYTQFLAQGTSPNKAVQATLNAFTDAAKIPILLGALLVVRDIVGRLANGVTKKPVKQQKMAYGKDATRETKQNRRILGKCYEGPFCRDFVRVHCPIFQQKRACWTVRRGCYCDSEIVSTAAAKVNGLQLAMAPDPAQNLANPANPLQNNSGVTMVRGGLVMEPLSGQAAPPMGNPLEGADMTPLGAIRPQANPLQQAAPQVNPLQGATPLNPLQNNTARRVELSWSQKKERCNNCVIYNEHQSEKYKVLMPAVMLGTVVLAIIFNEPIRLLVNRGLAAFQGIMAYVSFESANNVRVPKVPAGESGAGVEWFFFAIIVLILMSKALQGLEWAMFKAKI